MMLTQLAKAIIALKKEGKPIGLKDWPSNVTLETDITSSLKKLSKFTNVNLNKKEGPSGWEYEMTFIYFIDKLYPSEPVSGDYSQVRFSHSFNAVPEYKSDKVRFKVQIDKKFHLTEYYDPAKLGNISYGFIASFHTHPLYKFNNQGTYSFFSPADIKSLLFSNSPILGLIAGNHLWLACRTSSSKFPSNNELQSVSLYEKEGIEEMEKMVKELMTDDSIVFFSGKLGSRLKRII